MTSTSSAWESLTGRRDVLIGASFTRAWNERIGKTAKRSKGYPNPEYYSLRYNFKPESIDNGGAGTLTPKLGGDGHVFELERPSQQQGESHRFRAEEQPSKEWECVLLWDPVLQQLTLEKLESTLNLTHEGRSGTKGRPPSATPPSMPGSSGNRRKRDSASTSQGRSAPASPMVSARELEEDLHRVMTASGDADADGEPDDEAKFEAELFAVAAEASGHVKREEEEEEDEEMEAVDVAAAAPPPPPPPVKVKAPPKAKPAPKPRPRASTKRDRDDDIEEELLSFGEPSRPTKRVRGFTVNGATNPNRGLALPIDPPHPAQDRAPTPSELLRPPSMSKITYAGSESSESEEEEEEVDVADSGLDMDVLDMELQQQLAEDAEDEEEMEAVPLEGGHHNSGRPLSLNELFGSQSPQDDDTSSDDSDDD